MVGLILAQSGHTVGFLTILSFNLQAESFPTEVRSVGCGFCGVLTSLTRYEIHV